MRRRPTRASTRGPSAGFEAALGPSGRLPWTGVFGLLVAITVGHYLIDPSAGMGHDLFRRLHYLPIVWAAFTGGLAAGVLTAVAAVVVYVPHAFLLPHQMDHAGSTDKVLEIVLYLGVGAIAGVLVDSERRAHAIEERERTERVVAEQDGARLRGVVQLTRGLAHEVRNPLGSIHGAIEILASAIPAAAPGSEHVAIAFRECGRLTRMLDDFLVYARPREPVLARFDPVAVVEHVVAVFQDDARSAGVALSAPARGEPIPTCVGDSEQTNQVLANLVKNALQAAARGGEVAVHVTATSGSVRFDVSDTGAGVPTELGASIYDPYVTGRDGASGLGLSIAALLVTQQGGALAHAARATGGTTFSFSLPRVPSR